MAIKQITDRNQWDRFVNESPCGLVYHKWDFLKLAEKYTRYQFLPYGIFKGEQLICVFPLFYKKILGVRLLFSPPPQSGIPYLGPVMEKDYGGMKQDKKESYVNFIIQEMDAEIQKIKPNYFTATLLPEFLDIRPFQWLNYQVKPSYTYTIDLKPDLDELWENLTPLCRQNIRKGEDLKCRMARCEDTSILTGMLTERYNQQGLNHSVDPAYLKETIDAYPENVTLVGLYDREKLIGAVLNQTCSRYLGWMGLPKPKDKKYTYANEFMVWQLIQQAKLLGIPKFEIAGANKQNLCRYRSKFNPRLEIYFTVTKKDFLGKAAEAFYFRFKKKKLRTTDRK